MREMASFSEPSPRWGQVSAVVDGNLCVWGGGTNDLTADKTELASSVHVFNPSLESWSEHKCNGVPPLGLYRGACASAGHHIYVYGGLNGSQYQASLHQLNTRSWTWKELSGAGPMKKYGCRMLKYGSKLVLFGGYGIPSGPAQPGADFVKSNKYIDGRGWTNDLHAFDLIKGEGDFSAHFLKLESCGDYNTSKCSRL